MSSAWTGDESDFDDIGDIIGSDRYPVRNDSIPLEREAGSSRPKSTRVPLTTVCIDKLADNLNLRVTSITRKLALANASKSPPPTQVFSTENKSINKPPYAEVERLSPTSDFTLGSVDEPDLKESFVAANTVNHNHRRSINDSPLSSISIASGPELMFPCEDDGLGWIEIPKKEPARPPIDDDDLASPLQPLLDREAKLPPSAGALLGTATEAMSSWLEATVPKLPSRTQMCIVQDDSGAAYGTVKSLNKTETTGRSLKKKLKLPKLPNEVKSVKMYQDPVTSQIFLSVTLSRPLLAWIAIFIAAVAESVQSYILVMELRKPEKSDRSPLFSKTDVSVTEIWVMEGLLIFMLLCCLGAWLLGEFAEKQSGTYLTSTYGVLHAVALVVSCGIFTVPSTKHTAQTGWVNMLYALPPILMCIAKLCMEQMLPMRHLVGTFFLTVAFVAGMGLPDGLETDNWYTWLSLALGCIGLSTCVWSTKQVRPHLPLPFMVLLMAFGGFVGQMPFAFYSNINGEPARHDTGTVFFGWTDSSKVAPWMGLCALRCISFSGWTWSIMYLSTLTIAAALVSSRLVAMALLAFFHSNPETPPTPLRILPLLPLVIGMAVICSADLKDRERLIELQEKPPRTPSTQPRQMNSSVSDRHKQAHSLLSIHDRSSHGDM
eukprot:TRINITY_DN5299_c0_g2_i1.p1 TRINITY_DN5299_c0_g2~~TRINITY_DN5299_c0_g2_i1.p1  ORF type:complete len:661 (+),score=149.64 TRINITY_DN5299_c0_g2_i1:47-2029(+)